MSVVPDFYGYRQCNFFWSQIVCCPLFLIKDCFPVTVLNCLLSLGFNLVVKVTERFISFQSWVGRVPGFYGYRLLFLSSLELSVVPGFFGYRFFYFFPVSSRSPAEGRKELPFLLSAPVRGQRWKVKGVQISQRPQAVLLHQPRRGSKGVYRTNCNKTESHWIDHN